MIFDLTLSTYENFKTSFIKSWTLINEPFYFQFISGTYFYVPMFGTCGIRSSVLIGFYLLRWRLILFPFRVLPSTHRLDTLSERSHRTIFLPMRPFSRVSFTFRTLLTIRTYILCKMYLSEI